jgi:hypothetical protein
MIFIYLRTFLCWLVAECTNFTITVVSVPGSNVVLPAIPVRSLSGMIFISFFINSIVPASFPIQTLILTSYSPFFGTQSFLSTLKVIPAATAICNPDSVSLAPAPLDGRAHASQLSQLSSRWGSVRFDTGGNFTLCYGYTNTFASVDVNIIVNGVAYLENKLFCPLDISSECRGILNVFGNVTGRLSVTPYINGTCGSTDILPVFENTIGLVSGPSSTLRTVTFGRRLASTNLQSFRLCYCPDYEASYNRTGPCTLSRTNFVQNVGILILVGSSQMDPDTGNISSIVPTVKFNLQINCGTGGCSNETVRIKLVDSNPGNKREQGCSNALQSGGYISPPNCKASPTACTLEALPDPSGSGSKVVFTGIQLDGRLVNNVRIPRVMDVCFCDNYCKSRSNWFYVDSIQVNRISVQFTIGGNAVERPVIMTKGSFRINVTNPAPFRLNGSLSREMKLIQDNARVVGSFECAATMQSPSVVLGHECYTTTNCETPKYSSKTELIFGQDNISIQQPGWIAVCFCNSECTVRANWFVVGRLLFAGPTLNRVWTATLNLGFALNIYGWGLRNSDRIFACLSGNSIRGPTNIVPTVIGGSGVISLTDASVFNVRLSGTVVGFPIPHNFTEGDYMQLSYISSGLGEDVDFMLNNNHRMNVIDKTRVLISVVLDTPILLNTSAQWTRTNRETFSTLVGTQSGNFTICWSPSVNSPSLSVGTLVVQTPPYSAGSVGLSTIVPGTSAPVLLQFSSSASSAYASQGEFLKVIFPYLNLLEPLDRHGDALASFVSPSLPSCGLFFTEMNSVSGFAYPINCSTTVDLASGSPRREINILFSFGNGLKPSDTFSFVLMGKTGNGLSPVNSPNGAVEVWMMRNDGSVIEVVHLRPNRAVASRAQTSYRMSFDILDVASNELVGTQQQLSGYCSSSCSACVQTADCSGGINDLCVSPVSGSCARTNVTRFTSIKFGLDSNSPFIGGSTLRILFSPFNDWNLQTGILVTCSSVVPTVLGSTTESLVSGPLISDSSIGGNVLSITLPFDIAPNILVLVISIGSLRLPMSGFFPSQLFAEIVPPDLSVADPILLMSSVSFFSTPRIKQASLLPSTSISLRGDRDVPIHVSVTLGFCVGYTTAIRISPPSGYTCNNQVVAGCDSLTDPIACAFRAIPPVGHGILGERTLQKEFSTAGWTIDGNACVLTLKTDTTVYSRSTVVLALLVSNPSNPLSINNASNVWSISVTQNGITSIPTNVTGNRPVVGKLANTSITLTSSETALVFFRTESQCGDFRSKIIIEHKTQTGRSHACEALQLGTEYSSGIGVIQFDQCSVQSDQIVIETTTALRSGAYYGLTVNLPGEFDSDMRIRTETFEGELCAISETIVGLPIHKRFISNISMEIDDLRPGTPRSRLRIYPIRADEFSNIVRIVAPEGFLWNINSEQDVSCPSDRNISCLPISRIPAGGSTELIIDNFRTKLDRSVSYGIETYISVPLQSPKNTANVFVVEIGSESMAVITAPLVRVLNNIVIDFESSVAQDRNNLCMQLQTVTPIAHGEALVVEFQSSGFRLTGNITDHCFLIPWGTFDSSHLFPKDTLCYFDFVRGVLRVTAGGLRISPRMYRFCLSVTNPGYDNDERGVWRIYSVNTRNEFIDYPSEIPGKEITRKIEGGRYDYCLDCKPDAKSNSLRFWLRMDPGYQSSNVTIVLKSPVDFTFSPFCLADVSGFIGPFACTFVSDREVLFFIPHTIIGGTVYNLTITGIINPQILPTFNNLWTITVNNIYSVASIRGVELQIFRWLEIIPSDYTTGRSNVTLNLRLVAQTAIPGMGKLTLRAPTGFVFPSPCVAYTVYGASIQCTSSDVIPSTLNLTISSAEGLTNGSLIEIFVGVTNPVTSSGRGIWRLTSFDTSGQQLDTATVPSYEVIQGTTAWKLLSMESTNGGQKTSVVLSVEFPQLPAPGDHIEVRFPPGYTLNNHASSECMTVTGIESINMRCVGNTLTWDVPASTRKAFVFKIVTVLPAFTPQDNTFVIRHNRGNVQVSFGTFIGTTIIRQLSGCSIQFAAPIVRSSGSISSVIVRFNRTFSGPSVDRVKISTTFNLSQAIASLRVLNFTDNSIILSLNGSNTNLSFEIVLSNVFNPSIIGESLWSISILSGDNVMDLSPAILGPHVTGHITVLRATLTPSLYGSTSSLVILNILSSAEFSKGDTLSLTAPDGFIFLKGSEAGGSSSQKSIQSDMVVAEDGSVLIELLVAISSVINTVSKWRLDHFSSEGILKATNDGLFSGFWLSSTLPFNVFPSTASPSMRADLHVTYQVPMDILIAAQSIVLQVVAPIGFLFSSSISCLSAKTPVWMSCVGSGNIATLQAASNRLQAGTGSVDLVVLNPVSSPLNNTWTMSIYIDDNPGMVTNIASRAGYSITAMNAKYLGSSRLGSKGIGFFTFVLRTVPQSFFQVLIQPPAGFTLLCDKTYHVGMNSAPLCSGNAQGITSTAVSIIVPRSGFSKDRMFSIAVTVINPPSVPLDSSYFSLIVQDSLGNTIDANMRLPTPLLAQVFIGLPDLTFNDQRPLRICTVTLSFNVEVALISKTGYTIRLDAPSNYVLGSPGQVQLSQNLHVAKEGLRTRGNTLSIVLQVGKSVEADKYTVSMSVMNPGSTPYDNFWTLYIVEGKAKTYFQALVEGYLIV